MNAEADHVSYLAQYYFADNSFGFKKVAALAQKAVSVFKLCSE